jgi:hypothetical protein
MSRGDYNNTPPEKIFRKPTNLKEHYYPRKKVLPYKSPVVAWTSERVRYYDEKSKETVEGIRLQPLERRFRINHVTGEDISVKS